MRMDLPSPAKMPASGLRLDVQYPSVRGTSILCHRWWLNGVRLWAGGGFRSFAVIVLFCSDFSHWQAAAFLLPLSLPLLITTLPLSRARPISRHVNSKSITAEEIKRGRKPEREGHKNKTQTCGEKREAKMMKEEGKQHKWEGELYGSGAKREVGVGGET